jgi:lathosterol oxidase
MNDEAVPWRGPVCLLSQRQGLTFWHYWFFLTLLSLITLTAFSGMAFYSLYWKPSFAIWPYKINPNFPTPAKVKEEILVMLQGLIFSTLFPSLSVYFMTMGWGRGYCGISDVSGGWTWMLVSGFLVWIITDVYEFLYHYTGHVSPSMWSLHKHHHRFHNPSPFAVIADGPVDQLFRAAPLVVLPLMIPINLDMIFSMFSLVFYLNGLIQHSGFEIPLFERVGIDGHNQYFLTSYHHYLHHSKSTVARPLFNGQFFQVWDKLFNSADPSWKGTVPYTCQCSKCGRSRGERDFKHWRKIIKPDYSVLLSLTYWFPISGNAKSR